ncbi:MAG: orotate phosphoribosyltransferase-like protein [Archaeoglobaceae archaeon]|nr:orotate phosphoribosyltransferase-like protein [Archaeoglobaceae archaeon]MCX8152542.1 orotate phosphoribosyltransferase-like protein [Archaeoglobaceae archaeon]MDW8014037.1 orotate phosphoribosyltransferase-like protein [Archaeoglobaceae archaeon]
MRVETLVEKAKKLKEKGLSTEEIADELNVSFETALWLLTRATEVPPSDIYVEWRNVTKPSRLRFVASALVDLISEHFNNVEVVVGVAISGIPLASLVAEELAAELAIYYPKKLNKGVLSENFARVSGKNCIIVDDIISTGRTAREASEVVKASDGKVLGIAVVIDKKGSDEIDSVPVISLMKIVRI